MYLPEFVPSKKNPMNNPVRLWRINLAILLSTAITCMAFLAGNPIKEIQYKLIFHNFLDSEPDAASLKTFIRNKGDSAPIESYRQFNPVFYPDTSLVFNDPSQIGESIFKSNGRYLIRSIESNYYSSPGFLYRYTRDILGEDYPSDGFVKKYKQQFGLSPFTKTVYTAKKEAWHFWSGAAVEKIFQQYYGKPGNRFQQVTYGIVYNVAAKKYMKDYVFLLNHLLVTKKTAWINICKNYEQQAMNDSTFDGSMASYRAFEQLISPTELQQLKVMESQYLYHPIGELIRRQIDGSLPSIIKCIRTILADYDPATAQLLKI